MSIKYLSLSLVAAAATVLVVGAAGVAGKASFLSKKSAPSVNDLAIPQIKTERIAEVANFKAALSSYDRLSNLSDQSAKSAVPIKLEADIGTGMQQSVKTFGVEPLFAGGNTESLRIGQATQVKTASAPLKSTVAKPKEALVAKNPTSNEPKRVETVDLPKVTVVVTDGKSNKAVINGNLVGVGAQLSGGYVVKEIKIDSVVVANGYEETLIKIPLQRLRVLGASETRQASGT